jgi:hypothetical protein
MMTEIDPDTAKIFAQMETAGMLLSYIHRIEGRDGLVRLLDGWPKATLMKAAVELAAMEMPDIAEAVLEAADNASEPENPFPEQTANWRDWQRRHYGDYSGFYFDDDERAIRARDMR